MVRMRRYCHQCGCLIHVTLSVDLGLKQKTCLFFETECDDASPLTRCPTCLKLLTGLWDVRSAEESLPATKVFDLGDVHLDRFTVCFGEASQFCRQQALSLSMDCDSVLGVSQWCQIVIGSHLGKEILFDALPFRVQDHVVGRYLRD